MESNVPRNLKTTLNIGPGLASERTANDVSVSFVSFVSKLEQDLIESRRREAVLIERMELLEKQQQSDALQTTNQQVSTRLLQMDMRLSRLEAILHNTPRSFHSCTWQQPHDINVGDCANLQTVTPSRGGGAVMPNGVELVTPVRAVDGSLQVQTIGDFFRSPPMMVRQGTRMSDRPQAPDMETKLCRRQEEHDGKQSMWETDKRTVGVVPNNDSGDKTISREVVSKSFKDDCPVQRLGEDVRRMRKEQTEEGRKQNSRKSERHREGPIDERSREKEDMARLKRRKRSSSRSLLSTSDSPTKVVPREAPKNTNTKQRESGNNAAADNLLYDDVAESFAKERDSKAIYCCNQGSKAALDKHHEGRVKHSPLLEGVRAAGDAVRLARKIGRGYEHDANELHDRRAKTYDAPVERCAECTQRFREVAPANEQDDARRLQNWLYDHCQHQSRLKESPEKYNGHPNLSSDDAPTQAPF